jgi:hypothetical protein
MTRGEYTGERSLDILNNLMNLSIHDKDKLEVVNYTTTTHINMVGPNKRVPDRSRLLSK